MRTWAGCRKLPEPVTNLSLGQRGAHELRARLKSCSLAEHDVIEITLNGKKVKAPVMRGSGPSRQLITVHLG